MNTAYDRVTTVLNPFSGYSKIHPGILDNAKIRGTKVHQFCDAIIKNVSILGMEEQYKGYVESFKWWAEPKKIISQPGRLYCDRYMITGEIDLLLDTREGLVLVDLKTPAKEGKTWNLQGSAYSYLCKKNDFDVSKILFVKLAKNGDYPKVYEYIENMPKFVKCLEIYREFFKNDSDIVDEDFL